MNVSPKATAGSAGATMGGQIMVIVVWVLGLCHIAMPPEVAVAFGGVLSGGMALGAAYIVPHIEPTPPAPAPEAKSPPLIVPGV